MKKINCTILLCCILLVTQAQYVNEYKPAHIANVGNMVNLVSVTETFAGASGHSRAVATLRDTLSGTTDVWVHSITQTGVVTWSKRYGTAAGDESASAIFRCPNGDFVIAANTMMNGFNSAWIFRIANSGAVIWSRRYFIDQEHVKASCITRTNEAQERYAICGTTNKDQNLLVFKIDANGNPLWSFRYNDPGVVNNFDIPKSMFSTTPGLIIAGNRVEVPPGAAVKRDIFAIGIDQNTGAVNQPYMYLDNGGNNDVDPFITPGNNSEVVLTYSTSTVAGGAASARIAFNRLTPALALVAGITNIYNETNTVGSYGHTIYRNSTSTGYDIGGGTTVSGVNNPLFFSINNTGNYVAGTYRRLWTARNFRSTFMLRDQFVAAGNQFEFHNIDGSTARSSMSLMRDDASCFETRPFTNTALVPTRVQKGYQRTTVLANIDYPVTITDVHGAINRCNGSTGNFRQAGGAITSQPVTPQPAITGFKVFPSLLAKGANLQLQLQQQQEGDVQIAVYNQQMQKVYSRRQAATAGMQQFTISTTGWAPGTYIVECVTGRETHHTKVIRQ